MKLKPRKKKHVDTRPVPLDPERQAEVEEFFAIYYVRTHNVVDAYRGVFPKASYATAKAKGAALMQKPLVKEIIADAHDQMRKMVPKEQFYHMVWKNITASRSRLFRCKTWDDFDALPPDVQDLLAEAYTDKQGKIRYKVIDRIALYNIMQRLYISEEVANAPIQNITRERLDEILNQRERPLDEQS